MKYYILLAMLIAPSLPAAAEDRHMPKGVVFDEMAWEELAPGITVAQLWKDEKSKDTGFLMKVVPGFEGIGHGHTNAYQGITIQGTWVHTVADGTEYTLPKGSFAHQPALESHSDNCVSDVPCILLIHMAGDYDFFPTKQ